jgi:hypothetical protein
MQGSSSASIFNGRREAGHEVLLLRDRTGPKKPYTACSSDINGLR